MASCTTCRRVRASMWDSGRRTAPRTGARCPPSSSKFRSAPISARTTSNASKTISVELASTVRVDELLANGGTRSFEFFPPKSDEESAVLARSLEVIDALEPSFVSVTYRGGNASRQRTFDLVTEIQSAGRVTAMAHLICVGHRRDEMRDVLKNY